ncbi:uncharacterized protein K441DRAFT_707143 [Cenococcum geophilum 1.58]|uniref:uncharacterized protein n=1 Tax=Cenococcum geophilum 1.58 TaxID=794803 RepID=UPI00358F82F7|nr:hypothetical protein K441DRAFT_707143 [Cenococcum geophilum 1.58]
MKLISATLAFLSIAAPALAAVGGRCSNNWGDDCICLDDNVCRNRWGGDPYTGTPSNWPCPSDPDNIMACVVRDCPGHGSSTQCLWREGCQSVNSDPVCPGGRDFVCCNHNYLGG